MCKEVIILIDHEISINKEGGGGQPWTDGATTRLYLDLGVVLDSLNLSVEVG